MRQAKADSDREIRLTLKTFEVPPLNGSAQVVRDGRRLSETSPKTEVRCSDKTHARYGHNDVGSGSPGTRNHQLLTVLHGLPVTGALNDNRGRPLGMFVDDMIFMVRA